VRKNGGDLSSPLARKGVGESSGMRGRRAGVAGGGADHFIGAGGASGRWQRGHENKWLPLHTLTFSHTIDRRLLVILLAPEEREMKEGKNKNRTTRDRISLASLYSTRWEKSRVDFLQSVHPRPNHFKHQVWPLARWGHLVLTFLRLDST
jgi:hypothetical protein